MVIDITKVVGDSYNMLFKNKTLLVLGVVGALISTLLGAALGMPFAGYQNDTSALIALISSPAFWAEMIIGIVALELVSIFIVGAIISAASAGDKAELGASVKKSASRYMSLLGTCIVSGILSFLAFIPGIALLIAAFVGLYLGSELSWIAMIAGAVLLIIPGFFVLPKLWLSTAACVVGGKRAVESVKSSWSMTKGSLWRIMAVLLIIGIVEGISGGILTMVNKYLGIFAQVFLTYAITIAMVLVYTQLAEPEKAAKKK